MRASAVAERAGIRSVSIVASGFLLQAKAIAKAQGLAGLPIAEYPGVPMTDSREELQRKVKEGVVDNIIQGLTNPMEKAVKPVEPGPRDIVFNGTLEEVHEFFNDNLWTDGLPIIPPTLELVERFLNFTDKSPDEVIGILLPENRQATVWNIAVNGIMAGCRPEYMPILIAVIKAIAKPEFHLQDAGSTPGWEPLIILNGPIIKELDFNYKSGVMRVGRQANTSVGRFLRLYMRNVAGLRIPPGNTDKGCIAGTFNVVLAENEEAVKELNWEPFSVERGFQSGENIVTVMSALYTSPGTYSGGHTAQDHLETITEIIGRAAAYKTSMWAFHRMGYMLIVMSPSVARVMAKDGVTKRDITEHLYKNVKMAAGLAEKLAWQAGISSFSFCKAVEEGRLPREYCESADPNRLVPVFLNADSIGIVISGDPERNQSKGYVQNHIQGPPTSKKIELPGNWEGLLKNVGRARAR